MAEPKKISFGFSKLTKRTNVFAKPLNDEKKKIELIDCLEGQSIKIKDVVEVEKGPLVIPVKGNDKNLLDRVREANELKDRSRKKYEVAEVEEEDTRPDSELTLDELAARQLLREAKNYDANNKAVKIYSLPAIEDKLILEGSVVPTEDDYENVPISDYGLAMLRGMGWKDGQGIGKSTRVAPVTAPELRPKGMGLGANKMVAGDKKEKPATDKDGKEISLKIGVHAKVIAGKDKGYYCTVQGLDDEAGRVIVKMALKGDVQSLNEFLLHPVTPDEFAKSSKVLNNAKYEEFKEKSSKLEEHRNGKIKQEPSTPLKQEIRSSSSEERAAKIEKPRNRKNFSSEERVVRKEKLGNRKDFSSEERTARKEKSGNGRDFSSEERAVRKEKPRNRSEERAARKEKTGNRKDFSSEERAVRKEKRRDSSASSDKYRDSSSDRTSRKKYRETCRNKKYRDPSSDSRGRRKHRRDRDSSSEDSRERRRERKKKQKKERRRSSSRSRSKKSHKRDDSEEKRGKRKESKKKSKHRSRSSSDSDHRKSRRAKNDSDCSSDRDERRHRRRK